MSHGLKNPSLGRNPSADYLKRRRSWSLLDRKQDSLPDVRTFLGTQPYPEQSLTARRERCAQLHWRKTLNALLVAIAIVVLACVIIAVLAILFRSGAIYTQYITARDGTVYYVNHIDRTQLLILLATFVGAAAIVVAAYAVFCVLLSIREGRQRGERNIISLQDIRTGDVEHGDTHLRTKQSIAKLMSEAEKQYVAEYVQKSPPGSASQHVTAVGVPAYLQDGIKVQQLNDGAAGNSVGLVQGRSWSLKRMWSGASRGSEQHRGGQSPPKERTQEVRDPSEMAARLSSPDAFNRVASAYRTAQGQSAPTAAKAGEVSDPSSPSTPSRGDAIRQRLVHDMTADAPEGPSPVAEPRIMVTIPIEQHNGGSAPLEIEEEDFDKGRQHSVLPYKAGNQPFQAKVLTLEDEDSDFEDSERTAAWQEVHLESDDEGTEGSSKAAEGHLLAEMPDNSRQQSSEPKASIKFQPVRLNVLEGEQAVKGILQIDMEEVLPRPQAGLLNRLLRLAKVEWLEVPNRGPVFIISPGKEHMVGLKLKQKDPDSRKLCVKWLRIQPADGQAVRFNAEEESNRAAEWCGSACWDTTLHNSELLTTSASPESDIIPVHVTICLDHSEPPFYKIEAKGTINVLIKGSSALERLKASGARGGQTSSPEYHLL